MQTNFALRDPLDLNGIRGVLIRLEETIIFYLIERAQFAHNPAMYRPGHFKEISETGFAGSWLEWFLHSSEVHHARARRYTAPDEYPFSSGLPEPILPPLAWPKILHPNKINVNPEILKFYTEEIVPRITRPATEAVVKLNRERGLTEENGDLGDDSQHGSAATIDIEVLRAISKRVHYGKFVSESKFRANPAAFIPHILTWNRVALEKLITKPEVERMLLQRLRNKVAIYGQQLGLGGEPLPPTLEREWKIDVEVVVELYERWIIPLTKILEVDYLICRLEGLSQDEIDTLTKQPPKQQP